MKRILWLFGHTSLRNFEAPLLIDMGYEVYCPKIFDVEYGDRSASISYEYDKSLTIPLDIVEKLNSTNFFKKIDKEILDIVNRYFDIVFCMVTEEPLRSMIYGYYGVIVLHVFGIPDGLDYTNVVSDLVGLQGLNQISKLGNRFWFSQTYDNLDEIEGDFFKRRSIYMPIGNAGVLKEKWTGGDERFLFIGAKIKTNAYYKKVYDDFKASFGDMPHLIGGGQLIPVDNDKNVLGFLPKEQYVYNMTHLCAMYYHSRNSRHLHYHPIEAIEYGMPLIFMSGGLLDHLGGKKLPGRCKTISEARNKLKRLSQGDKRLIKKITESQKVLLEPFKMEYCRPFWDAAMKQIDDSARTIKTKARVQKKSVVVVVPAGYLGGVLDYSVRFCLSVVNGAKYFNDQVSVTFAYPQKDIDKIKNSIKLLEESNVFVMGYTYEKKNSKWINNYLGHKGLNGYRPKVDEVCVLRDGMYDFANFDFAFIMSDASPMDKMIFWTIPYVVVVHDYIQHYVPDVISNESINIKLMNQRFADYIFVTSEPSFQDAISYAGIEEDRVCITPYMLELGEKNKIYRKENYFIWSTNAAKHKNHICALDALYDYYMNGGTYDCYITGVNTKLFLSEESLEGAQCDRVYVEEVRKKIDDFEELKCHLHIKGNLPKSRYIDLLSGAAFVFHPGYGDNGNGSVFDAASMRVPALVSDYPQMRYMERFMGVHLNYMDPFDYEDMKEALFDMEYNCKKYAEMIPGREELSKADYKQIGVELYKKIREIIRL